MSSTRKGLYFYLFCLLLIQKCAHAAPNLFPKVSSGEEVMVITTTPESNQPNEEPGSITTSLPLGNSSIESLEMEDNDIDSISKVPNKNEPAPDDKPIGKPMKPEIYSFRIESNIRYRYSRTYVTSRVVNRDLLNSQEISFRVVLPETAFISKFVMEIDGTAYEAYVKEKEEAKRVYNAALSQGQSAGLVEASTRNSNIFNVNVNIKPQAKVTFNLTYEELLSRKLGHYEQAINISPDQISSVKDFQIVVNIEESQNITYLRIPSLRNDLDAPSTNSNGDNSDAVIKRPAANKAKITWSPSIKDQESLSKEGITGKFVTQYDIIRDTDAGEVLLMEGYFVHFFAPGDLKALQKHIVFILDVSGSMWGRRLEQLKESQKKILDDLTKDDFFNIITFSSDVHLWSPDDLVATVKARTYGYGWGRRRSDKEKSSSKNQPIAATKENIEKAKSLIDSLEANGGTNIHDSLIQALDLIQTVKDTRDGKIRATLDEPRPTYEPLPTAIPMMDDLTDITTQIPDASPTSISKTVVSTVVLPKNVESLVIFLTDGEPTEGYTSDPTEIQKIVKIANSNLTIPIYSLGFGEGADFSFLRRLSLQNFAFARKIYEASDAALQLQGFYNEIASPLLSNVIFNYTSPDYNITDLTITHFPTLFNGTEIAVAGKIIPYNLEVETEELETSDDELVPRTTETSSGSNAGPIRKTFNKELTLADKRYLDVSIVGSGREGPIDFDSPQIFCGDTWGLPPLRPFPPRPTPPPTQEDQFLERLWAYLTIKQLIEKDISQGDSSNTVDSEDSSFSTTGLPIALELESNNPKSELTHDNPKETPKQHALRLALKYGFVTPLTSLVVVKPNVTDVTDALPSDARPAPSKFFANALIAPQSIKSYNTHHLSNRIISGSPGHGHNSFSTPFSRPYSYAMSGMPHPGLMSLSISKIADDEDAVDYDMGVVSPGINPSASSKHQSTPTLTLTPLVEAEFVLDSEGIVTEPTTELPDLYTTTDTPALLTIESVQWYNTTNPSVTVNKTEYIISLNRTDRSYGASSNLSIITAENCEIRTTGEKGQCTHLANCVQKAFVDDIDAYRNTYFCAIESGSTNGVHFAGTCCPKGVLSVGPEDP